jgi:hypothetical protein
MRTETPDSLKLNDLNGQTLILKIHVTRQLRFRLALAKRIFTLGAAVLGCKVEFV